MSIKSLKMLLFVMMLLIVVSSTPRFGFGIFFIAPFLLSLGVISMNLSSNKYGQQQGLVLSVVLFVLLMFFYKILNISTAVWGSVVRMSLFFVMILLMILLPRYYNKMMKYFWWTVNIIILFNILHNILLSIIFPEINIARRFMEEEQLALMNAGGSKFYSLCLFYFDVCYLVFLNTTKKTMKYFMLLCVIVSAAYILAYCNKASVVVLFVASLFLIYYAGKSREIKVFIRNFVITGLFIWLFLLFFNDVVLQYIIDISPSERLAQRLSFLISSDSNESSGASFYARQNLAQISLNTWIQTPVNFVFGIGDHRTDVDAASTGIGQHSDIIDLLARFGIIGMFFFVLIIKKSTNYLLSLFEKKYQLQVLTIILIMLISGLAKSIFTPQVGSMMFIMLPISSFFINDSFIIKHGKA